MHSSLVRRASLAVCFAASLFAARAATAEIVKGQKAPDFSLSTLKGNKVSLAGLRGKVVLIDFWAEWCAPCKKELPELDKIGKDLQARGVVIVAVNIDKQKGNAERLVKALGLSLDPALDPNGTVAAQYDLPKMPTSYVVDKKGTVRFIHEGFDGAKDAAKIRAELEELAKQ